MSPALESQNLVRQVYAPQFCLVTTKIWSDGHLSPWCVSGLGQTMLQLLDKSVLHTAPCYSLLQLYFIQKIARESILRCKGMPTQRREEKRAGECSSAWGGEWGREQALAPHFYMFFLPLGLPYVNWASQECCFFYLRSSPWSSDLPLFYFLGLFPSLSFNHCHSGLLFPILTT